MADESKIQDEDFQLAVEADMLLSTVTDNEDSLIVDCPQHKHTRIRVHALDANRCSGVFQ